MNSTVDLRIRKFKSLASRLAEMLPRNGNYMPLGEGFVGLNVRCGLQKGQEN
jgi:hypothetical protein